ANVNTFVKSQYRMTRAKPIMVAFPILPEPQAAGDVDRLAGHIRRLVGAEERGEPRDVVRLSQAPERNGGDALRGGRQAHRLDLGLGALAHAGLHDDARADGVNRDFLRRELERERLGDGDNREFRGAIGAEIRPSGFAEPGGDVDDPPLPAPLEMRNRRPAGMERAVDVDAKRVVPILLFHLGKPGEAQDAGTVDEDVELAEL